MVSTHPCWELSPRLEGTGVQTSSQHVPVTQIAPLNLKMPQLPQQLKMQRRKTACKLAGEQGCIFIAPYVN